MNPSLHNKEVSFKMLWNDYVGNRHINLKNNDMMPFILQVFNHQNMVVFCGYFVLILKKG